MSIIRKGLYTALALASLGLACGRDPTQPDNDPPKLSFPSITRFEKNASKSLYLPSHIKDESPFPELTVGFSGYQGINVTTKGDSAIIFSNKETDTNIIWKVTDPEGLSSLDTTNVQVYYDAKNPVAKNSTFYVPEDSSNSFNAYNNVYDPRNQNLAFIIAQNSPYFTATKNDSLVNIVTAQENYNGNAGNLELIFTNEDNKSDTSKVNIIITPIADKPRVYFNIPQMQEDTSAELNGSIKDVDKTNKLSIEVNSDKLSSNTPVIEYISSDSATFRLNLNPLSNYYGDANVNMKVSNSSASRDTTFAIPIAPVNDAPMVSTGDTTEINNVRTTLTGNATDVDNNDLTINWQQIYGPNVNISNSNDRIAFFTPSEAGIYKFLFSASDNDTTISDTANVKIDESKLITSNGKRVLDLERQPVEAGIWAKENGIWRKRGVTNGNGEFSCYLPLNSSTIAIGDSLRNYENTFRDLNNFNEFDLHYGDIFYPDYPNIICPNTFTDILVFPREFDEPKNLLKEFKRFTATNGEDRGTRLHRWREEDLPIRIFWGSNPPSQEFLEKVKEEAKIIEDGIGIDLFVDGQSGDSEKYCYIQFMYPLRESIYMGAPGHSDTDWRDGFPNNSSIQIARDIPLSESIKRVVGHEVLHALSGIDNDYVHSDYQSDILSIGSTVNQPSEIEFEILKILFKYKIPNLIDMKQFRSDWDY